MPDPGKPATLIVHRPGDVEATVADLVSSRMVKQKGAIVMLQNVRGLDYVARRASTMGHQLQPWRRSLRSFRQAKPGSAALPAAIVVTDNVVDQPKQAGWELLESERNLRLMTDAIPGMVVLSSATGEVEYVNKRVLDYTGRIPEDMAVLGWTSMLHPDDAERLLDTWLQSINTGQPHIAEFRLRRRDGVYRWFQSRSEGLRETDGRILRWYTLIHDIEDWKNPEQALRETEGELAHIARVMTLGELAASIAHEIKQPLAAVITNGSACLRWLSRESPDLDEAREATRRLIRDGNRASDVVTSICALVRKTEPQNTLVNINEVLQEVVPLVQSEAALHGVTVGLDLTCGLPEVFGDRVQLQQVALNLMMNGIEAMISVNGGPKELWIHSRSNESGEVLVSVQDCGEGIDNENLERIFNSFYTTKSQGLGMGLAISRLIVEAHRGCLWATPNRGAGSTIQFTLPSTVQATSSSGVLSPSALARSIL